jgi:hypothetical protein
MAAAASSNAFSSTWPYVSTVVAMFEWPRMREAVYVGMPFLSRIEPAAWRRSWDVVLPAPWLHGRA